MTRPEGAPLLPNPHAGILGTSFKPASALLSDATSQNSGTGFRLASPVPQGESFTSPNTFLYNEPNDPYDSPAFDFTSQEITDEDLELCALAEKRSNLWKMVCKLYINAVKRPLQEFHSIIIQREELLRIRESCTPTLQSCLSTKVAQKIQAERPAEKPVLIGLIREETEKSTATLHQKFQSISDQLDAVRQQQTNFMNNVVNPKKHHGKLHSHTPKNFKGGNKQREQIQKPKPQLGRDGRTPSTVAAASSTLTPQSTSTFSPQLPTQGQADIGWGRPRGQVSAPSHTPQQQQLQSQTPSSRTTSQQSTSVHTNNGSSATTKTSGTVARKRKNTKSWSRSKSQKSKQN